MTTTKQSKSKPKTATKTATKTSTKTTTKAATKAATRARPETVKVEPAQPASMPPGVPTAGTELERLATHAVQLVDELLVTRSKLVTPLVDAAHSALTNLARGVDRATARWLAGDEPATGGQ